MSFVAGVEMGHCSRLAATRLYNGLYNALSVNDPDTIVLLLKK